MSEQQQPYGHEGGKGDPSLAAAGAQEAQAHLAGHASGYGVQHVGASPALAWEGGFAAKAQELHASGVDPGTATTHQYALLSDASGAWLVVRQNGTNGVMEWSSGAAPLFIPGA